jgi:hypothetical protein
MIDPNMPCLNAWLPNIPRNMLCFLLTELLHVIAILLHSKLPATKAL